MSTFAKDSYSSIDLYKHQALAAWNVLYQDSVDSASTAFLKELLEEDSSAFHAFLVLKSPGEENRSWGLAKDGTSLKEIAYHLNHQAVQRSLSGDLLFTSNSMGGGKGSAFGQELFLSSKIGDSQWISASVRRSMGAPPFDKEDTERLGLIFSPMVFAFERILLLEPKKQPISAPPAFEESNYFGITCKSPAMQSLVAIIEKVKDTDFNLFIAGESGSGKEMVARAIHQAGKRQAHPFIAEACGAVADSLVESELFGHVKGAFTGAEEDKDGLFVLAHSGSLYLDEIGDMSPMMQRKLLRVIQEGEIRPVGSDHTINVDVRLISSTHKNIEELIEGGEYRADLYWRLNGISIPVPPLRQRQEDLPLLVREFQAQLRSEGIQPVPFSESAMRTLMNYHWPGNVRQLHTVLRRTAMAAEGREISKKELMLHLSSEGITPWRGEGIVRDGTGTIISIPSRGSFRELVGECEKAIILNSLKEHNWNKSQVTRVLKIPRQSLYNKMEKYNIQPDGGNEEDADASSNPNFL